MSKLVVTGMGIISGLGIGKEKTLEALLAEKSSVGKIKYLQTAHTDIPVSEVPMSDEEMKSFLNIPQKQLVTRTPLMAIVAAKEAIEQAKLQEKKPKRIAFINGTTVGGMEKSEQFYIDFLENENHKEYIAAHDCGAGTDDVADYFGIFDMTSTISTACSSAINALILGANLIKTGKVDAAVVGGTEGLSKFHLNGFNTLMILDRETCKPFSQNHVGLNLGEGAAYLVIEKAEDAEKRGAETLCELSGYANFCDAFHQTATSPNGQGPFLAMQGALADANLQPTDIDFISAHGTGTGNNDTTEGIAITRVFGENVPDFSSTKAFTGHTTSAAGSVESVISILALQHNFIPANLNFSAKMEDVNVVPVTKTKHKELNHVMNNSFGFGGNDSSCIFSKIK